MEENLHKPQYSIRKAAFALFAALLVVSCIADAVVYLPGAVTVSNIAAGRQKMPVYSVKTEKKQAALTFDVTSENENPAELLKVLAAHNVRASFFVNGDWVEKYPDSVLQIYKEGHDLGNYSASYEKMSPMSLKEQQEQILKLHEEVKTLTGTQMELFRPPFGDFSDSLIRAAEACGYKVVQGSIDSMDWKDYGADSIFDTVVNSEKLGNGAIIIFRCGAKYTKEALDAVIEGLQNKGYELVPLSGLLYQEPCHTDENGVQFPN